jgi:hypothetical protein
LLGTPPRFDPFANLGWRGWLVLGVCGTLALGLLILQIRQLLGRRVARG